MELPVRLHVDGVARAERDHLDIFPESIDDPETSHPVAAKALELVAERLAAIRVSNQRFERGSDLALEHGMEAADERRDLVRDPQSA